MGAASTRPSLRPLDFEGDACISSDAKRAARTRACASASALLAVWHSHKGIAREQGWRVERHCEPPGRRAAPPD